MSLEYSKKQETCRCNLESITDGFNDFNDLPEQQKHLLTIFETGELASQLKEANEKYRASYKAPEITSHQAIMLRVTANELEAYWHS